MTAGFQSIGSHGVLQIDQDYFNLQFKAKGTFTTGGASLSATVNIYKGEITITAINFPVIAIRSTAKVGFIGFTKSGSSWTFYYGSDTTGATVEYYHFDTPDPAAASNYLEIFNASGVRAFNAAGLPMRVVDNKSPSVASTTTYTSGRKYASMQSAVGWSFVEAAPAGKGSGSYRSWIPAVTWLNDYEAQFVGNGFTNGLKTDDITVGTTTQNMDQYSYTKFIIIDVTGY